MEASIVSPDALPYVWAKVRPQILRALNEGMGEHYSEDYYYKNVNSGIMQMWVFHEESVIAAGVFSVIEYPNNKTIFIELIAGERLDAWLDLVEPMLMKYAEQIGATTIEALCRPGLVKKLTRWRPVATLMRLDNGR